MHYFPAQYLVYNCSPFPAPHTLYLNTGLQSQFTIIFMMICQRHLVFQQQCHSSVMLMVVLSALDLCSIFLVAISTIMFLIIHMQSSFTHFVEVSVCIQCMFIFTVSQILGEKLGPHPVVVKRDLWQCWGHHVVLEIEPRVTARTAGVYLLYGFRVCL